MGLRERFSRRPGVPPGVAATIALEPGERLLAAAQVEGGGWLVASTSSLRRSRAGGAGFERVAWSEIATASWGDDVQTVKGVAPGLLWRLRLPDPGLLPETVRERVTASVLAVRTLQVPGGSVSVAVRRVASGPPLTQVVADPGVDMMSPALAVQVDQALAQMQSQLGG